MPQVSVIIPTYNVEKYIDICLGALLIQSFNDFEILCIDDCSTDNTLQIIKQYAKLDERVKIIPNTVKGGPDVLRGVGIQNAQSPYCVFVDADDFFSPFMLEKYVKNIEDNDSDFMCGASLIYSDKTHDTTEHTMLPEETFLHYVRDNTFNASSTPDFFPFMMNPEFWGKIFKTEFIKEFTFTPDSVIQDISFCFKCFFKAKKISYLLEPLYVYNYRREGSLTASFNEKWLGIFSSLDEIKQTILNAGMFEKYKNTYINFKLSRIWFYLLGAKANCQQAFFEHTQKTFGAENFSDYDFNVLRKNKFYFPTLDLLNSTFAEFHACYVDGGDDDK